MDSLNQEGPFDNNNNGAPPQKEQFQQGENLTGDTAPHNDNTQQGGEAPRTHYTQQNTAGYGAGQGNATASQQANNVAPAYSQFDSMYMPTNLPPQPASSASEDLNKAEMAYLRKLGDQNYAILKKLKKFKQARPMDDARALSRVRKLYSMNFARRYFGFPPKMVKRLRDRLGSDVVSAFSSAAQRTKRMVLIMVMIVAILATIGTGAVVAIMAYNSNNINSHIKADGLVIILPPTSSEDPSPLKINGYVFGAKLPYEIKIRNNIGAPMKECYFCMYIEPKKDTAYAKAVEDGLVDPSKLKFIYDYDTTLWKEEIVEGRTMLRYLGNGGLLDKGEEISVIKGFAIDIDPSENANNWVNYSATLVFFAACEPQNATDKPITGQ